MEALWESLQLLVSGVWNVLIALGGLLLPWTPLAAWIVFWLFGVNWQTLRGVLLRGGWMGLVLIGLGMVLIWGMVAPPPDGFHHFFGMEISNFVGKTVYVTSLFCIMLLCGSVQLSGMLGNCCQIEDEPTEPTASH